MALGFADIQSGKIENATLEIMECVNRSVLSYEGSAEHYIHYLARSLKQRNKPRKYKIAYFSL